MLYGIDVSNWQKGLQIPDSVDFVIAKATEGSYFVDACCDTFIQQAINKKKLFGFYHFARNNSPEVEACHFADNTIGYRNKGIPVLDIEDPAITNWGDYAQRFVDKYHAITGVYPMIYCSASQLPKFKGYPLTQQCGLWIAGYPSNKALRLKDVPKFPYSISPWEIMAVWQFTSNGWLENWDEPVDMDIAYMDEKAWMLYARAPLDTQPMPVPKDPKTYHFSADAFDLDITLK